MFLLLSFLGLVKDTGEKKKADEIWKLRRDECGEKIAEDLAAWRTCRQGLMDCRAFVYKRADLFPPHKLPEKRLLTTAQKDEIRALYSSFLDYILALDSLGSTHKSYRKIKNRHNRHGGFLIAYGSFLAQYAAVLDVLARCDNDPALDTILNEDMPALGVPEKSYAALRFRFLNMARATEFTALEAVYKARMKDRKEYADIQKIIRQDASRVWDQTGRGSVMTLKNAGRVIKKAGFTAYFPIQKGVASWMGETKIYRRGENNYLIRPEQIRSMAPRLRPGDILLTRRDWHLSNIGLPGFWTHAMLYVGTAAERRAFFDSERVRALIRDAGVATGDFEDWIKKDYPEAAKLAMTRDPDGNLPRIFEAIGPGVVFRSLEHGASSDSVVALRPRLDHVEIARALHRALAYTGRPYDYNFDFQTDSALVCSELIYKAYEPCDPFAGLTLPLSTVAGRFVLPPNEICKLYAETRGQEDRPFEFVFFFESNEKEKRAEESTADVFCSTWRRPKWRDLARRFGDIVTID
ncbi:MAG: YiiX/YebB-like N1pC/P60 family cysteine hydrolase [Lentisphaeria bacterium]|nr:YiiX/YebB-like N1pC/P60 family cysteine hydrolase [Lentisphaeria bacterium]